MKKPKVSVIIRCYNEEKHIGKLLVGLSKQKLSDHEIIIVDSGSTDDTLQIARRFPCRIVNIKPEEFSFGRALNLGCREAQGEFLVFASAHVYPVYDDWLDCLIKPFENQKIGAVYGKQRGDDESRYSENQVFAAWYPEHSISVQDTPFSNNANCAVRRELWEAIPYDEDLTGLEDLDWAKKILARGFRVSYAADAEIIHVHRESSRQIFNRYQREAIAFKRIFPDHHMSFFGFARLLISNTASDYLHALREHKFLANIADIPRFRFLQFWGSYHGLKQRGRVTEQLKKTFYYPRSLHQNVLSAHGRAPRGKINYEAV